MSAAAKYIIEDEDDACRYVVCWRRKGENFVNREYCSTLAEADRWKESHEKSSQCDFCVIEREHAASFSGCKKSNH